MKNIRIVVLLVLIAVSLSACGPSAKEKAETQAEIDQYNEWEAQVAEISPLLESALYGAYDVELKVYQLSGAISASVEVESGANDRSDFGAVVSLLGNRFIELSQEYEDYTFGDISFFYYITANLGRRLGDPSMTYSIDTDGVGTFTEPGAAIPGLFDKTPDEIYYHLSGVSPDDLTDVSSDTRSISNPTWAQEALVPENSFSPISDDIFSTTASENGLEDTAFFSDGVISEFLEVEGYDLIRFSTESGDLYVGASFVPVPEFEIGTQVTMFFVYEGWSSAADGPICSYIYHE